MRVLFWSILLFCIWLVLSANIQIANILVGIIVSVSIAFLYNKLFKHTKFESINIYWFMVYIVILLKNIIISNFSIAKRVLSKNMHLQPAIVSVKTELTSEWKKLFLANSITLTPGTLTLDIKDDTLYIHTIECKDIKNKQEITKEFEEVIAKL